MYGVINDTWIQWDSLQIPKVTGKTKDATFFSETINCSETNTSCPGLHFEVRVSEVKLSMFDDHVAIQIQRYVYLELIPITAML